MVTPRDGINDAHEPSLTTGKRREINEGVLVKELVTCCALLQVAHQK